MGKKEYRVTIHGRDETMLPGSWEEIVESSSENQDEIAEKAIAQLQGDGTDPVFFANVVDIQEVEV